MNVYLIIKNFSVGVNGARARLWDNIFDFKVSGRLNFSLNLEKHQKNKIK